MKKLMGIAAIAAAVFTLGMTAVSAEAEQIPNVQAQEIAIKHAKVGREQANFIKEELKYEAGTPVYKLEFYAKGKIYKYDINADTGDIMKKKTKARMTAPSDKLIGIEKAKSIAAAQVQGASEKDVKKVSLDKDNGRSVYEVDLLTSDRKYEFKIDAETGAVVESDMETR